MELLGDVPRIISIHALREEGDSSLPAQFPAMFIFLSTPSARRATSEMRNAGRREGISIHALREEGDRGISSAPI